MRRIASRVSQLNGEGALEVFSRAKELERQGRSIIHLELGDGCALRFADASFDRTLSMLVLPSVVPEMQRYVVDVKGWTSAGDTLNEVRIWLDTLDEAVAFAAKEGVDYTVVEPQVRTAKQKSYADNFRYDRIRG